MTEAKPMTIRKFVANLLIFAAGFLVGGLIAELTGVGGPGGLWDGIRPNFPG